MVKNPPANAGDIRDGVSILGSGRSLEEGMEAHSSILAGESHERRSQAGDSHRGHKELDATETT